MTVRQLIPAGLAEMAPGPELGALLAGIDIHALTGSDVVEVLRARSRQLSHEQARLLATMVEVGLCDPDAGGDELARLTESPRYAADEIRAALTWTRRAADRELDFAETLMLRMPTVFTALDTGRIDRNKAWIFADLCADLTAEQAETVCTRLLPRASGLTTGELAARIKKLAIALDPDWAARRYASAVRERNVIGYLDPDGTATVTGTGLPVEQAANACARVEELARAAKRAGHPGRIGPLRANIYLGLLDGRWQHMTREEIVTDLLTHATSDTGSGTEPDDANPATTPTGTQDLAHDTPADPNTNPGNDSEDGEAAPPGQPVAEDPTPLAQRVGVEVRVGLLTLLGRDEHPGEVPGWGPIPASVARTMVRAQRAATWRYAITDATGQLLVAGITCRRTRHTASIAGELPPCRGGIVELHVPATLLMELATDLDFHAGAWAGIVTDLADQYSRYTLEGWRGLEAQDPSARFAGAALRRHVQIRDRCCVHPGCRAGAHSADLDHTHDHTLGGTTTEINSGPLCRHDHQLKTEGRWRLLQPDPGHFTWISPLGKTYRTQSPPITDDLPDPRPRPSEPDEPSLTLRFDDEPILERPPPPPEPPPPDLDEPPPF